jgi:chemotaxis protein methyltransferase CheR
MPMSKPLLAPDYEIFAAKLGNEQFEFIRQLVRANAGIALGPAKREMVQGRLLRRLRDLRIRSFEDYCAHVSESGPEELVHLINAITTNVTAFFRENHHFELLASRMLPEAMERNGNSRRLRIWSAGCSSGEEPYSIAITALESLPLTQRWDLKILATDIDSDMVRFGATGLYPEDRLEGVSEERRRRWFQRGTGQFHGMARAKPELLGAITFRPLNLLHEWPVQGPFDVIFCRNTMIYFDQATREHLLERFARLLAEGGYLCIGHSESIPRNIGSLRLVGRTVYCKLPEHGHGS